MIQKCSMCGRERALNDVNDYTPLQVIMILNAAAPVDLDEGAALGAPLGWYSGNDGEFCGDCMTTMLARQ